MRGGFRLEFWEILKFKDWIEENEFLEEMEEKELEMR